MLTDNEFSFASLLENETTHNSLVVALLSQQRFINYNNENNTVWAHGMNKTYLQS